MRRAGLLELQQHIRRIVVERRPIRPERVPHDRVGGDADRVIAGQHIAAPDLLGRHVAERALEVVEQRVVVADVREHVHRGAGVHRVVADERDVDATGLERLTNLDGDHRGSFNAQFSRFVDVSSTLSTPPQTRLRAADGKVISVLALRVTDGKISEIFSIVNPDKLAHIGGVADVAELLRLRGSSKPN